MQARRELLKWQTGFFFANLILFYLVGAQYLLSFTWPTQALAQVFAVSLFVGQIALLCFIVTFVIPTLVGLLLPRAKVIIPFSVLLAGVFLVYLTTDANVYRQYHFHFNGVIMRLVFSPAFNEIFQFSRVEWQIASCLVAGIFLLEGLSAQIAWRSRKRAFSKTVQTGLLASLVVSLLTSHLIYAWGNALYIRPIVNLEQIIPFHYGLTARNFLLRQGLITQDMIKHQRLQLDTKQKTPLHYPLHPLTRAANAGKAPNILFIVIDDWRSDTMTSTVTPNIYKFAQRNLHFQQHFSGGDCTQPGMFSLFYALPPTYWHAMLGAKRAPVFMQTLQRLHYQMAIYGSAPLTVPPFYVTLFSGIKHVDLKTAGNSSWQRDAAITDKMRHFLDEQKTSKSPFFGFLFYDSVHAYNFPSTFKTPFNPWWRSVNHFKLNNHFDPAPYFNRYKNSVNYVDNLVGHVLGALKKSGKLQNTIVVITSDHGEEFNDNHKNYWGHASNFSRYQLQVPLIIHWPGKAARQFAKRTSHFDIVPSLMRDALGITNPISDYAVGSDLFKGTAPDFMIVGSYQHQGLWQPTRLTTFYRGGAYRMTDQHLNPVPKAHLNIHLMKQAFSLMHRYYH
jgi:uncharacterized protein